jgi:Gamma-glutamyl cyclotransferase, AIG2-like
MDRNTLWMLTGSNRARFTPAVLQGYRRQPVIGMPYPAITPKPGFSVKGFYLSGLTDNDMRKLDNYEGSAYARKKVNVVLYETNDRDERHTEAYIWKRSPAALQDKEWEPPEQARARTGHADSTAAQASASRGQRDDTVIGGGRGQGASSGQDASGRGATRNTTAGRQGMGRLGAGQRGAGSAGGRGAKHLRY